MIASCRKITNTRDEKGSHKDFAVLFILNLKKVDLSLLLTLPLMLASTVYQRAKRGEERFCRDEVRRGAKNSPHFGLWSDSPVLERLKY